MVGIGKISPVYPGRRVDPADEKRQQKKKKQEESRDQQPDPEQKDIDDGNPHIDEYA